MSNRMLKNATLLLLLFVLTLTGCHNVLMTGAMIFRGREQQPKYDILLKGEKTVAVVPRAVSSNAFELQNAPQEIARQVHYLLEENILNTVRPNHRNKKLTLVEQAKVEKWLDNCNNNFDSFAEVGRDRSIKADIVVGFTIVGFQIRDPRDPYMVQGKCHVEVEAVDAATGKVLASETLIIVYPPSSPMHAANPALEPRLRREFVGVIAQHIAALFHWHIPHELQGIDADSINLHRL